MRVLIGNLVNDLIGDSMSNPTIYKFKTPYGEMDAMCIRKRYMFDGSMCVELWVDTGGWWEPWATMTVCLGGAGDAFAFLDTNNFPEGPAFLEANGLAKPTGLEGHSGYCTYPLYEFTDKFFDECDEYGEE